MAEKKRTSAFKMDGGVERFTYLKNYSQAVYQIFNEDQDALKKIYEVEPSLFKTPDASGRLELKTNPEPNVRQIKSAIYKARGKFNLESSAEDYSKIADFAYQVSGGKMAPTPQECDRLRAQYLADQKAKAKTAEEDYQKSHEDLSKARKDVKKGRRKRNRWLIGGTLVTLLALGLAGGLGFGIWTAVSTALASNFGIAFGLSVGGIGLALLTAVPIVKGIGKLIATIVRKVKEANAQIKQAKAKYKEKEAIDKEKNAAMEASSQMKTQDEEYIKSLGKEEENRINSQVAAIEKGEALDRENERSAAEKFDDLPFSRALGLPAKENAEEQVEEEKGERERIEPELEDAFDDEEEREQNLSPEEAERKRLADLVRAPLTEEEKKHYADRLLKEASKQNIPPTAAQPVEKNPENTTLTDDDRRKLDELYNEALKGNENVFADGPSQEDVEKILTDVVKGFTQTNSDKGAPENSDLAKNDVRAKEISTYLTEKLQQTLADAQKQAQTDAPSTSPNPVTDENKGPVYANLSLGDLHKLGKLYEDATEKYGGVYEFGDDGKPTKSNREEIKRDVYNSLEENLSDARKAEIDSYIDQMLTKDEEYALKQHEEANTKNTNANLTDEDRRKLDELYETIVKRHKNIVENGLLREDEIHKVNFEICNDFAQTNKNIPIKAVIDYIEPKFQQTLADAQKQAQTDESVEDESKEPVYENLTPEDLNDLEKLYKDLAGNLGNVYERNDDGTIKTDNSGAITRGVYSRYPNNADVVRWLENKFDQAKDESLKRLRERQQKIDEELEAQADELKALDNTDSGFVVGEAETQTRGKKQKEPKEKKGFFSRFKKPSSKTKEEAKKDSKLRGLGGKLSAKLKDGVTAIKDGASEVRKKISQSYKDFKKNLAEKKAKRKKLKQERETQAENKEVPEPVELTDKQKEDWQRQWDRALKEENHGLARFSETLRKKRAAVDIMTGKHGRRPDSDDYKQAKAFARSQRVKFPDDPKPQKPERVRKVRKETQEKIEKQEQWLTMGGIGQAVVGAVKTDIKNGVSAVAGAVKSGASFVKQKTFGKFIDKRRERKEIEAESKAGDQPSAITSVVWDREFANYVEGLNASGKLENETLTPEQWQQFKEVYLGKMKYLYGKSFKEPAQAEFNGQLLGVVVGKQVGENVVDYINNEEVQKQVVEQMVSCGVDKAAAEDLVKKQVTRSKNSVIFEVEQPAKEEPEDNTPTPRERKKDSNEALYQNAIQEIIAGEDFDSVLAEYLGVKDEAALTSEAKADLDNKKEALRKILSENLINVQQESDLESAAWSSRTGKQVIEAMKQSEMRSLLGAIDNQGLSKLRLTLLDRSQQLAAQKRQQRDKKLAEPEADEMDR